MTKMNMTKLCARDVFLIIEDAFPINCKLAVLNAYLRTNLEHSERTNDAEYTL